MCKPGDNNYDEGAKEDIEQRQQHDEAPKSESYTELPSSVDAASAEAKVSCMAYCCGLVRDWFATLIIGFFVVTYWRGSWLLLDIWTCNQPEDADMVNGNILCFSSDFTKASRLRGGTISYIASIPIHLLGVALVWLGFWTPPENQKIAVDAASLASGNGRFVQSVVVPKVTFLRACIRAVIVYILGWGTVNMWRGLWYFIDYFFLPEDPVGSFWYGTLVGLVGAYLMCAGDSLLAPPCIFLRDGPCEAGAPPPLTVTLMSTYYSLKLAYDQDPPKLSIFLEVLDFFASFFVLPLFVLFYWSSFWQVMDLYWYGFTPSYWDMYKSMIYSAALSLVCMVLGSDDVIATIRSENPWVQAIVGRLRTFVLAIGNVAFWRVIWNSWDHLLGGATYWSAWMTHWLAVFVLLAMGCMSCITAPPSTLGLDAVPHPDAAETPLFSGIPIPAESLFFFGIMRQPPKVVGGGRGAGASTSVAVSVGNEVVEFTPTHAEGGNLNASVARSSLTASTAGPGDRFRASTARSSLATISSVGSHHSAHSYHSLQRPGPKHPRPGHVHGDAPAAEVFYREVTLTARNQHKRDANLTFRDR